MPESRGIVYIATGNQFVTEARVSARTVLERMPDVNITLITDISVDVPEFDTVMTLADPRDDFGDQVYALDRTPYDRTVFLDTDIYLTEAIDDMWDLLDEFDIAAAHNKVNWSSDRIDVPEVTALPECFPEYNSGVVAFKKNERVDGFFEEWRNAYRKVLASGQIHNQAAFRVALYRSDVRIATLPTTYNCVFRRPGCVNGKIKAFHGRILDVETPGAGVHVDVTQAIEELNADDGLRTFYRVEDEIHLSKPGLFEKGLTHLRTRGMAKTVVSTMSYVTGKLLRIPLP
jgi:hypothetical protein